MMNHRDANERNEGGPEYPAQFHSVGQMPAADELMRFRHVLFRQTRGVWITPTLILANTVVFLAMALVTKNLMEPPVNAMIQWGANFGPRTMHGEWWRLLTSMFLHFGPLHLACNMWALWNLGQLVERLVGNVGFLILYLAAGLLGGLASLAWNPEIASAGASGAVFGVSGGLIGFLALRRDSIPMPILQSLQSSMASFVGFNVLFGIMIPNIDMACHLGGLIGGVFCGLILSQPIEVGMAARRWRRNLACGAAATALICGARALLPTAPADVEAEFSRYSAVETAVSERFDAAIKQLERGELTDKQLGQIVEQEILPPSRLAVEHLNSLRVSNGRNRELIKRLAQHAADRQAAWELLAAALRENDQQKMKQFQQSMQDVQNNVRTLFKKNQE